MTIGRQRLGATLVGQRQAELNPYRGRDRSWRMPDALCAQHTDLAVIVRLAIIMGMRGLYSDEREKAQGRDDEGKPLHELMIHKRSFAVNFFQKTISLRR